MHSGGYLALSTVVVSSSWALVTCWHHDCMVMHLVRFGLSSVSALAICQLYGNSSVFGAIQRVKGFLPVSQFEVELVELTSDPSHHHPAPQHHQIMLGHHMPHHMPSTHTPLPPTAEDKEDEGESQRLPPLPLPAAPLPPAANSAKVTAIRWLKMYRRSSSTEPRTPQMPKQQQIKKLGKRRKQASKGGACEY